MTIGVPDRITLETAKKIIHAMIRFAQDNKMFPGSYAVVDEGGHVVAFERRDPAPIATADIAIDKAWTAATMKASGRMLEVITRGQVWRLNVKHKGRLTIIPGAVPIIAHGRIIGGIGHSGGSAEDDLKIAQAGLAALYREEQFESYVEEKLTLARAIATETIKVIKSMDYEPSSIAVVDEWGGLLLLYRMDNAPFGTLELARDKAWTAAAFRTFSENVSLYYKNYYSGIEWNERIIPVPGGVPFIASNGFIGAVGLAGNKPEIDKDIIVKVFNELGINILR